MNRQWSGYGLTMMLGALIWIASPAWSAGAILQSSAGAIARDLGKVTRTKEGQLGTVYLFEENHTSKVGQIEIANMLVRLYKGQGVRTIGLEGFTEDKLSAPWIANMRQPARLRVAARLLGDGELNSAEFLVMAYSDVVVSGIDDAKDYQVELAPKAASSPVFYLVLIAERSMSGENKQKFEDLMRRNKQEEALDFALNSDQWTKRNIEERRARTRNHSTGAELRRLTSIENEAKKRGVEIPDELARDMLALRSFLLAADRRSDAMVSRLAQLAKAGVPVAGIIGAAHTDQVVEGLSKKGVALAVIRPNALVNSDAAKANLSEFEGYQRKLKGLPVDKTGLGALLYSKKKPPPVLMHSWLRHKAAIYQATAVVVDSVLVNVDKPPYKFAGLPPGYIVDPKKVSMVGDEVIFAVEFDGEKSRETIWVRAAHGTNVSDNDKGKANIDERIKKLIAEADDSGGDKGPPKPPSKKGAEAEPSKDGKGRRTSREDSVLVARDIYARFSKDKAVVEKEATLTASAS